MTGGHGVRSLGVDMGSHSLPCLSLPTVDEDPSPDTETGVQYCTGDFMSPALHPLYLSQ